MDLSSWLWILLFMAFILGWIVSRYDIKNFVKKNQTLPLEYFKGLQYILNEEPDKAIDSFVQVAQLNPETVDLHFALGQMFRKKGEFTRSIRIHESLANRGLDINLQNKATIALAEDYYKAGMFDRAQNLFTPFINHAVHNDVAIKYLLIMAKLEQEWGKAVELAKFLPTETKMQQIFHLQCQEAQNYINNNNFDKADKILAQIDPHYINHIRYGLIEIQLLASAQNSSGKEKIINKLHNLIQTGTFSLITDFKSLDLILIFMQQNKIYQQFLPPFLQNIAENYADNPLYNSQSYYSIMAEQLEQTSQLILLQKYINDEIKHYPNYNSLMRAANFIIKYQKNSETSAINMQDTIDILLPTVVKVLQISTHKNYLCYKCGFKAKEFSWACHGCGEWESMHGISK